MLVQRSFQPPPLPTLRVVGGHVVRALAGHVEACQLQGGDHAGAVLHLPGLDALHQVVPDRLARVGLVRDPRPQLRRLAVGAVPRLLLPRPRRVIRAAPALDGGGRQPGKRWRRTFGQKKGAAFAVGAVGGDPLVIVEGEADALASVWLHPGAEVWAAGGGGAPALAPAILENRRRVVIEADPDGPGRDAALKLDAALGGRAEISWNQGGDPADVWTETLGERAAILEFDGGLSRNESEQRAWALAIERR